MPAFSDSWGTPRLKEAKGIKKKRGFKQSPGNLTFAAMQSIELLAPAKDAETGILAINHGADAVYIGASGYSARAAAGCTVEDISRLILHAHQYDARVYVAMNTLLYDHEFEEVIPMIHALYQAGADALIIQDVGLLECNLPPIPLHASTQMHNHSPQKIAFLASAGISRVVLARELSLRDIETIHSLHPNVELESFVHGSLCVSYSGQCYMSQAVAKRSANRGVCAQPCRSHYDLTDSQGNLLIRNRHLLSIKDLNRTAALSEMIDAGVCSFKIEGRLKDAAYVKNITAWYRRQLDTILDQKAGYAKSSAGSTVFTFMPDPERTFNRGYTDYFLKQREKTGTPATQKSMGQPLGKVVRKRGRELMVDTDMLLSNGDGLCYFDVSGRLDGFLVNRVEGFWILPSKPVEIAVDTPLFRNHDHQFNRILSGESSRRTLALDLRLYTAEQESLLEATDETGLTATVGSGLPFSEAKNEAMARRQIEEQLAKLGDTIFRQAHLTIDCPTVPFLPVSVINRMRREVTEKLMQLHREQRPLSRPTSHSGHAVLTENSPQSAQTAPAGAEPLATPLPYPEKELRFEGNVLNSRAVQFYQKHGVEAIEPAFEAQEEYLGKRVMTTRHCIKYEFGRCPRHQVATPARSGNSNGSNISSTDNSTDNSNSTNGSGSGSVWKEPLFMKNGSATYRLHFDCKRCVMEIYIETL